MKPASRAWATASPGSWKPACRPSTRERPKQPARIFTATWKPKPRSSSRVESGLLALDWWNGNRTILVDADLSGVLLGATLATRPEEIYRALLESTAYGTRTIIDNFEANGIPIKQDRGHRRPAGAQQAADADLRRREQPADSRQRAPGRAARSARRCTARWRPVQAAGGYDTIRDAAAQMASLREADAGEPIPEQQAVYEQLYREYVTLHDYFGRGANDVMKRLKQLRETTVSDAHKVSGGVPIELDLATF